MAKEVKLAPTHVKSEAQCEPVDRITSLKRWWAPDLATYRPYRVKVVGRTRGKKRDVLRFQVVLAVPTRKVQPIHEVDLNVVEHVWPALPSTAQMGKKGQFGTLLLTDAWCEQNVVALSSSGGGGKWPLGNGL